MVACYYLQANRSDCMRLTLEHVQWTEKIFQNILGAVGERKEGAPLPLTTPNMAANRGLEIMMQRKASIASGSKKFKMADIVEEEQAAKCRIYSKSNWLQGTIEITIVLVISYLHLLFSLSAGGYQVCTFGKIR